jgi:hypothetical protein
LWSSVNVLICGDLAMRGGTFLSVGLGMRIGWWRNVVR